MFLLFLGLTNKESELFKIVEQNIVNINNSKTKKFNDTIGRNAVTILKHALYGEGEKDSISYINGIFDIDDIPEGKRTSLKKFYDSQLLSKDELQNAPKQQGNYFKYGDTVLSACIYSLYINVICVLEHYQGIDVMGEFYTTFLRFTKENGAYIGTDITRYPYKIIHNELGIKKCRFYDLRGSYATKILNNGIEIRDVADLLGHKNIETTENFYISSTESSRKYATELFDNISKSETINKIIEYKIESQ